jgi:hypothetical protein
MNGLYLSALVVYWQYSVKFKGLPIKISQILGELKWHLKLPLN